ncbi:MAG TPA: hypothetical protein VMU40_20660 [Steroidobacteraceae bacterium]|nr:hypothetical protein [Steroidobacteraceae bacterium]
MKASITSSAAAIIAFAGLVLATGQAAAGCGAGPGIAGMKPMAYRDDSGGGLLRTGFGPFNTSEITGLWKFTFTAEGDVGPGAPPNALPLPNGTPVDAGFVTWHDDGTELMNSGRTPASGSFCMGVWRQIGFSTYKLNHWALSWIPDYQPGVTDSWAQIPGGLDELFQAFGPTNIEETISITDGGNAYKGMFRLTQYVNNGTKTPINDTNGAPVAFVIVGTVSATRITVD